MSISTEDILPVVYSPNVNYYGGAYIGTIKTSGKTCFCITDDAQGDECIECSKEFFDAFKKEFGGKE